jgi:hypothetical protein
MSEITEIKANYFRQILILKLTKKNNNNESIIYYLSNKSFEIKHTQKIT